MLLEPMRSQLGVWRIERRPAATAWMRWASPLLALLLAGAWRAASAAAQGQADGAALLAAMAAFGTVGLIDTLVDAPRFMLLCLLLCLLPGALARR